jgi:anti-sigma B factor antagonist
MKVSVRETEHAVVIKPEGEMILGTEANEFHDAIVNAFENKKNMIVIDLITVKFISSWGIGILMYGYTTTKNSGGEFRLASVSDNVVGILKRVKLDDIFEKYSSVEEALKN